MFKRLFKFSKSQRNTSNLAETQPVDPILTEKEYRKAFGIEPQNRKLLESALEHALDIRKFEIELYWKRASYFWTLIAAAFAAYFLILSARLLVDKTFLAFVVACIGFLFTFAWLEVNRGSKKWQENWENHVDMLEDTVTGPLYKTRLSRPDDDGWFERNVTGPASMSVSKINQIVSLFTLWIWLVLAYFVLPPFYLAQSLSSISVRHLLVGLSTIGFCYVIHSKGRSWPGKHRHIANLRQTNIVVDTIDT